VFKLFKSNDEPPRRQPQQRPIAGAGAESVGDALNFGSSALPGAADHLAKFESLGQVLVVTVLPQTLSGPEAQDLMGDMVGRSAYGPTAPGQPIGAGSTKPRHFVLDLQNVEYMDSACLGAMVELLTNMQSRGGHIALANAGRNVEYLFRLTQLDRVFPICRDVMQAIEAAERGPSDPILGAKAKKRKKKSA